MGVFTTDNVHQFLVLVKSNMSSCSKKAASTLRGANTYKKTYHTVVTIRADLMSPSDTSTALKLEVSAES